MNRMVCKVHKFNITATFIILGAEDVLFDKKVFALNLLANEFWLNKAAGER